MDASARTRPRTGVRPDRQDHWHALRVAAGLALPGVLLLAMGRPELLVYIVFGSFAGIYGRNESGWRRAQRQIQAGTLLCVGVTLGVMLSSLRASTWVLVAVEVAFATAGSVVADTLRLRPAGPFFFLFAIGATATVPADLVAPLSAIGLCVATALLSVLIGFTGSPAKRRPRTCSGVACRLTPAPTRCATRWPSRRPEAQDCCWASTTPTGRWPLPPCHWPPSTPDGRRIETYRGCWRGPDTAPREPWRASCSPGRFWPWGFRLSRWALW